jgi:RNA recognition motif-containing protein
LDSSEMADSAITSSMVQERLVEVGQHRIRHNKARRELVYTGTHGGPDGTERLRKAGPQLIVEGDMPTKKLFLPHATTLFLRNLDPSVTKQDIAKFFQPFCSVPRDVEGSAEFVTCQEGVPTGRAYVSFDELGEAEAALEALSKGGGRVNGLGPNMVIAKQVKELDQTPREKRPARSEDELLDSLNNWEQYVDPTDLEELLAHGISKEALDEALRAIRYHNPTFASFDQAMRSETMNPEKDAGGMYEELVQTYVRALKECLATPENPGPIYESLFFAGEEVDTEIFDREPERQKELKKRREAP